ncbi:hypothetical protein BT96DRAFT_925129 [Gymnopus androsaceus JB14]|uniref:Uncharacterized protein n=1 Tax=Gymnopus androsaceus JB14 TaxID=1447944 RepID=A0A6A4H1W8_9AGAR|nr:hypothetical protein BT96DRAFT_925129 [Gymnopus androsaceus JB14]
MALKIFLKFFILAVALPMVLGMTLDTPTDVTSGLVSDISWTATGSDSLFTLELNHPSFQLALANNIDPTSQSPLSVDWPIVPSGIHQIFQLLTDLF